MADIIYKAETYEIIGCAMEVHNQLGCGFLESVYQEALAFEFKERSIPFEKEMPIEIMYKGNILSKKFYADFLCYGDIILELKAVESITDVHLSQVINYLNATQMRLGLILNFGGSSLQYKRVII